MPEGKLTLLNAREAARYLHVTLFTLRKMEADGGLVPYRTPGGHRRYSMQMLHDYLENSAAQWERKKDLEEETVIEDGGR